MMNLRVRLAFGPLAAIVLCLGIFGLGLLVPGYNPVRQTVSEIGEVGSAARVPFTLMLCAVAGSLLIFASALREVSREAGHATLVAYLVGALAVCAAGVGVFAFPHAMHNVFGTSEIIGYQAPVAMAVTWRGKRQSTVVTFSWILYALLVLAIGANLAVLDPHGSFWAFERPFYGIVQRSLFVVWSIWCAGVGFILLFRSQRS